MLIGPATNLQPFSLNIAERLPISRSEKKTRYCQYSTTYFDPLKSNFWMLSVEEIVVLNV